MENDFNTLYRMAYCFGQQDCSEDGVSCRLGRLDLSKGQSD